MQTIEKMQAFAHDKQIKFLRSRAKRKSFIGGRGSGKTHTLGYAVGMAYRTLAREKIVLAGLTYVQLDLVVLPVIREALEWMNIVEYSKKNPYGHYVIGVKPPENWIKAKKQVGKLGYQYCMSFNNGFTLQFVSQDRAETHRGLNVVGLLNDESATMQDDFITKVLQKGVRGSDYVRAANQIMYKCHYDFSSASWTQEGMHVYKVEELWKAQIEERCKWSQKQLKDVPPYYLFLESTCLDNPVTGQAYWDAQKELSDPIEFDIEVANQRISTLPNGFYFNFRTGIHTYSKSYRYEHDDKTGLTLHRSNDYRGDLPLDATLDFNADILWGLVGQEVGNEARIINGHYQKPEIEKIPASEKEKDEPKGLPKKWAKWFADTYEEHETKTVFIYGDPGGNSRNANTSEDNKPFFDEVEGYLRSRDWTVFRRELKSYPKHKKKYKLLNMLLEESSARTPRIRINMNIKALKILIVIMQTTGVDSLTYQKDKSSEKKAKQREYATDCTDALDYWLWAKFAKLLPNSSGFRHR